MAKGEVYMKTWMNRTLVALAMLAAVLPFAPANAQLGDLIKQGQGSGAAGSTGKLGSIGSALSGGSLSAGKCAPGRRMPPGGS